MKLMTQELERRFAEVGSQEQESDPVILAKYFTPWAGWTWYATEYDPTTRTFFGLVHGFEREWGSFSLDELEGVHGPAGLEIERDLYFGEVRISQLDANR